MKLLRYKGFYGSIEVSLEDDCLFGQLEFIDPLVNYEAQTAQGLEQSFKQAVDDYLADCEAHGREPVKPYRGSFNVRIGAELHQKALVAAKEKSMNLNEFVKHSIRRTITST